MAGGRKIYLGHLALRRREGVDELAVVGEEQQARRVLIETADALDTARRELRREQIEDAQMMLWLARAFVASGLVEQNVGVLAIAPGRTVDDERQRPGIEVGVGVGADGSFDRHATVRNECAALAP